MASSFKFVIFVTHLLVVNIISDQLLFFFSFCLFMNHLISQVKKISMLAILRSRFCYTTRGILFKKIARSSEVVPVSFVSYYLLSPFFPFWTIKSCNTPRKTIHFVNGCTQIILLSHHIKISSTPKSNIKQNRFTW